jgi:hypothetical protein
VVYCLFTAIVMPIVATVAIVQVAIDCADLLLPGFPNLDESFLAPKSGKLLLLVPNWPPLGPMCSFRQLSELID